MPSDSARDRDPALDEWVLPPVSAEFTARVMRAAFPEGAAAGRSVRRVRRWTPARAVRLGGAVAVASCAAAVLLWIALSPERVVEIASESVLYPESGTLAASVERRTEEIAPGVTLVAEAHAEVDWSHDGTATFVTQRAGQVFYRVDPGARLVVDTGQGQLRSDDGCVTVRRGEGNVEVEVHQGGAIAFAADGQRWSVPGGRPMRLTASGLAPVEPTPPASSVATAPAPTPSPSPAPEACDCTEGGQLPPFEPSGEQLARWVDECRIHFDRIPNHRNPISLKRFFSGLEIREDERAELLDALAEVNRYSQSEIRRIHAVLTGAVAPEEQSIHTLHEEIMRSAEPGEDARLRRRLARERAGLDERPASSSRMSPFEELVRLSAGIGDRLQGAVAQRLGSERALELRRQNRGWPGPRGGNHGCE